MKDTQRNTQNAVLKFWSIPKYLLNIHWRVYKDNSNDFHSLNAEHDYWTWTWYLLENIIDK